MSQPGQDEPRPAGPTPYPTAAPPTSSTSVAVFVCGLLSVIGGCTTPLGLVALILAHGERKRVKRGEVSGDGLLTAGYVLGIIGTCILGLQVLMGMGYLAVLILFFLAAAAGGM